MKKVGTILVCLSLTVFSSHSFASSKQLVCPYQKDSGEIWRTDTIIFDTNDFTKDTPTLTKSIKLASGAGEKFTANYTVSPTHLGYLRRSSFGDTRFSVDRSTLELSFHNGKKFVTAQCEISDVEIPKDRAF